MRNELVDKSEIGARLIRHDEVVQRSAWWVQEGDCEVSLSLAEPLRSARAIGACVKCLVNDCKPREVAVNSNHDKAIRCRHLARHSSWRLIHRAASEALRDIIDVRRAEAWKSGTRLLLSLAIATAVVGAVPHSRRRGALMMLVLATRHDSTRLDSLLSSSKLVFAR